MKEISKSQQIIAYLANQKGCRLDTDAVAAMFGVHWKQVRNLAQMNIGFCSVADRGHTIEVFECDPLLSSTTSDVRETKRPHRREQRLPGRVMRKGIESTDN